MLSKNNRQEQLQKMKARRQRFALRKLTLGVTSVLIGFTFMGLNATANTDTTVLATGESKNQQSADQDVSNMPLQKAEVTLINSTETSGRGYGTNSTVNSESSNAQVAPKNNAQNTQTVNKSVQANQPNVVTPIVLAATTATEQSEDVSDWQSLANALNNANTDTINLTDDITITGRVNGTSSAGDYLYLNSRGISRSLIINGNGHAINFAGYSIGFRTINDNSATPWRLTLKDMTINGDSYAYSPFSFYNQNSADILTFDGVTTNLTSRPLVDSYSNKMKVSFNGNNSINIYSMPAYAVQANKVDFKSGTTTFNTDGLIARNRGFIIWSYSQDNDSTVIDREATVNIKTNSTNIKGILAGNVPTVAGSMKGGVEVNGNLIADMQDGNSIAIMTNNLTINGKVQIDTKQNNNLSTNVANGNTTWDGTHYAPITLDNGWATHAGATYDSSLIVNGTLIIRRDTSQNKDSSGYINNNALVGLISWGNSGVGMLGPTYTLRISNGATFDLQDNANMFNDYPKGFPAVPGGPNIPMFGMISMFGTSSKNIIDIQNPYYLNLERTGQATTDTYGSFLRLEGTVNGAYLNWRGLQTNADGSNIIGTAMSDYNTLVVMWDQGNKSPMGSNFWYLKNLKTTNQWGDYFWQYTQGTSNPNAAPGVNTLYNSNNTAITMGQNQGGTSAENGNNPDSESEKTLTALHLNSFLNQFNWWLSQRIAMGTSLNNNPSIPIPDTDKYQPEVKTIITTTNHNLSEFVVKDGIKNIIGPNGVVAGALTSNTLVDWTKTHWYNASEDATALANINKGLASSQQITPVSVPTGSNGNFLETPAGHPAYQTATIVYADGSIGFVNVPFVVTKTTEAQEVVEVTKALSTFEGYNELYYTIDKDGNKVYQEVYIPSRSKKLITQYTPTDFVQAKEGVTYTFDTATKTLLSNYDDYTIVTSNNNQHVFTIGIVATYSDGSSKTIQGRLTILELPFVRKIYTRPGVLPTPQDSWLINKGTDTWQPQSVGGYVSGKEPNVNADFSNLKNLNQETTFEVHYQKVNGLLNEDGSLEEATSPAPIWDYYTNIIVLAPQAVDHAIWQGNTTTNYTIYDGTTSGSMPGLPFGDYVLDKDDGSGMSTLSDYLPTKTEITSTWHQTPNANIPGDYQLTVTFKYPETYSRYTRIGLGKNDWADIPADLSNLVDPSTGIKESIINPTLTVLQNPESQVIKVKVGADTPAVEQGLSITTPIDTSKDYTPQSIVWVDESQVAKDCQKPGTYIVNATLTYAKSGVKSDGSSTNIYTLPITLIVEGESANYNFAGGKSIYTWQNAKDLSKLTDGQSYSLLDLPNSMLISRLYFDNGANGSVPKQLPDNVKFTWNGLTVDTSKIGWQKTAPASGNSMTITFSDGSAVSFNVDVLVLSKPIQLQVDIPQGYPLTNASGPLLLANYGRGVGYVNSLKWIKAPQSIDLGRTKGIATLGFDVSGGKDHPAINAQAVAQLNNYQKVLNNIFVVKTSGSWQPNVIQGTNATAVVKENTATGKVETLQLYSNLDGKKSANFVANADGQLISSTGKSLLSPTDTNLELPVGTDTLTASQLSSLVNTSLLQMYGMNFMVLPGTLYLNQVTNEATGNLEVKLGTEENNVELTVPINTSFTVIPHKLETGDPLSYDQGELDLSPIKKTENGNDLSYDLPELNLEEAKKTKTSSETHSTDPTNSKDQGTPDSLTTPSSESSISGSEISAQQDKSVIQIIPTIPDESANRGKNDHSDPVPPSSEISESSSETLVLSDENVTSAQSTDGGKMGETVVPENIDSQAVINDLAAIAEIESNAVGKRHTQSAVQKTRELACSMTSSSVNSSSDDFERLPQTGNEPSQSSLALLTLISLFAGSTFLKRKR